MDNKDVKIITYCALGTDGMNKVFEIGSHELNCWKKIYKKGFDGSYKDPVMEPFDVRKYYCDPDQTYGKNYNNFFFYQITEFLEKREAALQEHLHGTYNYTFEAGKGIRVCGTDEHGNNIQPFYLRSDQLGFSAPSNKRKHPYDLYITKSADFDKALEQVTNWMIESRTIGGSFLWPRPFYEKYNPARGGTITSTRKYYIQDRLDLTLWEIKYYYEEPERCTIMSRNNDAEESNLDIWLGHFRNFETYAEFFCFDPFVSQNRPIHILTKAADEPKWGNNGENPEIEITENLGITDLYDMLKFVNDGILTRSKVITGLL